MIRRWKQQILFQSNISWNLGTRLKNRDLPPGILETWRGRSWRGIAASLLGGWWAEIKHCVLDESLRRARLSDRGGKRRFGDFFCSLVTLSETVFCRMSKRNCSSSRETVSAGCDGSARKPCWWLLGSRCCSNSRVSCCRLAAGSVSVLLPSRTTSPGGETQFSGSSWKLRGKLRPRQTERALIGQNKQVKYLLLRACQPGNLNPLLYVMMLEKILFLN